jgi:hypothetical protein
MSGIDRHRNDSMHITGTLTISSRYAHDQLKVCSRSAEGTLTFSSRYAHDQLKVRSQSVTCVQHLHWRLFRHSRSSLCKKHVFRILTNDWLAVMDLLLCQVITYLKSFHICSGFVTKLIELTWVLYSYQRLCSSIRICLISIWNQKCPRLSCKLL